MPGIKSKLVTCKANALPAVLWLQHNNKLFICPVNWLLLSKLVSPCFENKDWGRFGA